MAEPFRLVNYYNSPRDMVVCFSSLQFGKTNSFWTVFLLGGLIGQINRLTSEKSSTLDIFFLAPFLFDGLKTLGGYGSIPINTIFNGMNIHLPAILMWTTGVQGFDTLPGCHQHVTKNARRSPLHLWHHSAQHCERWIQRNGHEVILWCETFVSLWFSSGYPLVNIQKTMENHHF